MSLKVAIVIVVYNKSINDSLTLSSIENALSGPDKVLVLDNSTKDNDNFALCREKSIDYHSMNGNAGLSKAYNKALDILTDDIGNVQFRINIKYRRPDDEALRSDNIHTKLKKKVTGCFRDMLKV